MADKKPYNRGPGGWLVRETVDEEYVLLADHDGHKAGTVLKFRNWGETFLRSERPFCIMSKHELRELMVKGKFRFNAKTPGQKPRLVAEVVVDA